MSAAIANQIAAGEVVERPASCVKELVENSIDAGAHSIHVGFVDGGISAITVQDDGCGMDAEDAVLAFSRHATSKLTQARDLFRVSTLGFRGEALASIAAVAKVTLQTRQTASTSGTEVRIEGTDDMTGPQPIGMPVGTRIEIRDLFFNTPARLKYLRTVQTEQARSVEVVQKAALGRPDISFRCTVENHVLFQTPGRGDVRDVLAALFSVGEARQFIPFAATTPDYNVSGYIGRPNQAKASRAHGHVFINQRPIRNMAVHQAIVAGYQARLMVHRQPMYCIYIEMDPTLVDVNVHPHKTEVRFSEERDLCMLIQNAVKQALDEALLIPSFQFGEQSTRVRSDQQSLPLHTAVERTDAHQRCPEPNTVRETPRMAQVEAQRFGEESNEEYRTSIARVETHTEPDKVTAYEPKPENWVLRPVGQALGMYMIADDGECLYIIDQHAAHERVLFEQFQTRMRNQQIHAIRLLTPLPRTLRPTEHAFLLANLETFATMGLEFESFGAYDVLLRTIPDVWEGLDVERLLEEVLQQAIHGQKQHGVTEALRDLIVMRACKAAIKANWYLSQMEMEALCQSLTQLADPFHCPHGRPVFIRMTKYDLEKGFKRIV